jgi:iron complex transport system substrate-binding protein
MTHRVKAALAALLLSAPLLAACGPEAAEAPSAEALPRRIVSLDYCADQHAVMLAGRDRILALSPDAEKGFSYVRREAAGLPTVKPRMEDVLLLKPDLVIRSYGGGPGTTGMLERAGIEVLQVPYVSSLEEVWQSTLVMGEALGEADKARALVGAAKARLAALARAPGGDSALYLTAGGATTGPGSLVHELILAAGHENFETRPGWRMIDLEKLAFETPGFVASTSFGAGAVGEGAWSPVRHPIARAQLTRKNTVALDGALTACGGVFLVEAAEALAAHRP